ncbi:hypothetical protein DIPPA_12483 [Diplonema papillatum]|nr:hypothetical protein DIPPA_12483 [Diplonema papillatum]
MGDGLGRWLVAVALATGSCLGSGVQGEDGAGAVSDAAGCPRWVEAQCRGGEAETVAVKECGDAVEPEKREPGFTGACRCADGSERVRWGTCRGAEAREHHGNHRAARTFSGLGLWGRDGRGLGKGQQEASDSHPPSASSLSFTCDEACASKCDGWKQTGGCKGKKGPREPAGDRSCGDWLAADTSGRCECSGERTESFDCGHAPLSCDLACLSPAWADFFRGASAVRVPPIPPEPPLPPRWLEHDISVLNTLETEGLSGTVGRASAAANDRQSLDAAERLVREGLEKAGAEGGVFNNAHALIVHGRRRGG